MMKWRVNLSNKGIYTEGEEFKVVEGEKSPWLQLLDYIEEKKLRIVNMSLVDGDRVYNLPGLNDNPTFRAFQDIQQPDGFKFFRMLGSNLDGSRDDTFAVIEAKYGEQKLQLWVDEYTKNSWCIIK